MSPLSASKKRFCLLIFSVFALICLPAPSPAQDNSQPSFKKSWISVESPEGPFHEGESFDVVVNYELDPSEVSEGGVKLVLMPLGPWIDNPDGKYTKDRHHVYIPGLPRHAVAIVPGKGTKTFSFKAEQLFRFNGLIFSASFEDVKGAAWPWQVRARGPRLERAEPNYSLKTLKPGSLFLDKEPLTVRIVFNKGAVKGESKTLNYTLVNVRGEETPGVFPFTSGAPGESVEFTLQTQERGALLLEGDVSGWGKRELVLARIPDVVKMTGGKPTPFGATNLSSQEENQVARLLGFSWCRQFFSWKEAQPGPDVWKLERWDKIIQRNTANGITPWICIYDPPAWMQGCAACDVGYEPFPFDDKLWRKSAETLAKRWKGRIYGWEWLNEIVPGNKSQQPIEDYLRFCRIGTETVKAIDPNQKILMAGGLWPRNFRVDLLNAGIGKYIDVLPIHYSNMEGVFDAQEDVAAVGLSKIPIWDNETSNGLSVWDMPLREMLQITCQSQWVLDRWPDELVAGADRIILFGGETDCAGNWSYLLDSSTPRPFAATLAVLISKLGEAKPLGKFFLPGQGVFHLFEKDGKPILVASSSKEGGEKIELNVGSEQIVITDYQGNETVLPSPGGKLNIDLKPMRVFMEGGSLAALKSYLTLSVGSSRKPVAYPQISLIAGIPLKVPMRVVNPFKAPLQAEVSVVSTADNSTLGLLELSLQPGTDVQVDIPIILPAGAKQSPDGWKARIQFDKPDVAAIEKPFGITWIDSSMLGNLLRNGGFEQPGKTDDKAARWQLCEGAKRVSSDGGLGLGDHVLKFEGVAGYMQAYQNITPPPGRSYLYTTWAYSHDMQSAGSNVSHTLTSGSSVGFYIPATFEIGPNTPSWRFMAYRTDTPPDLKELTLTPLGEGKGWVMYDNMRVTLYEGTNFAAEAHPAKKPVKIDGDLSEWNKECPIPLLCDNQLTVFKPGYKWTPENLSGVAYLQWDSTALYVAAEVIDDKVCVPSTGDKTPEGDSLVVAIHPAFGTEGRDDRAFEYFISQADPGGGSGKNTLYRPKAHCGGLTNGQLARDSSVYDLAIRRQGNKTIYEVKIPWSELGGIRPELGAKFGLSLQLNDNDGTGRAAAMHWGGGLHPAWAPSHFGIATMVGP